MSLAKYRQSSVGSTSILITTQGRRSVSLALFSLGYGLGRGSSPLPMSRVNQGGGFSDFLQVPWDFSQSILPLSPLSFPPILQPVSASNCFLYSFTEFSGFSPKPPATI